MFLQFIPYIRIYFCILILPVYQSFHFILSFYSLSASSLFLVQPFFKTQFFNHQHHIVVVVGIQISNLKTQVIIIILPSIAKCINPFRRLIRFWHFQEVDFGFCSFSFNLRQFYFLISHRHSKCHILRHAKCHILCHSKCHILCHSKYHSKCRILCHKNATFWGIFLPQFLTNLMSHLVTRNYPFSSLKTHHFSHKKLSR